MGEYDTFTNSELENELEELKSKYEMAQQLTIEKYQEMLSLAKKYGEVEEVLLRRMGKK